MTDTKPTPEKPWWSTMKHGIFWRTLDARLGHPKSRKVFDRLPEIACEIEIAMDVDSASALSELREQRDEYVEKWNQTNLARATAESKLAEAERERGDWKAAAATHLETIVVVSKRMTAALGENARLREALEKRCRSCGHLMEGNPHGFDQSEGYLCDVHGEDGDHIVHVGHCIYCKVCQRTKALRPAEGEATPATEVKE